MQPEPTERLTCLIHAVGDAAECAAGINRISAKLASLGRPARFVILDDGACLKTADITATGGQTVESVTSDAGYGDLLRRGFAKAGNVDWVLRLPAVGLEPDFLDTLFARARMGVVNPDLIMGTRPVRSSDLWQAVKRAVHETLFAWMFGIVVGDPSSPVQLIRRKVLRDSEPQAESRFADYELAARANFVGHLLDEVRLKTAWTGGPPPAPEWGRMWRDAYRLLNISEFPRRLPDGAPAGGGASSGAVGGAKGKKRKNK